MSVTIRIPTVMQPYVGGQSEVHAQGATVGEALQSLTAQHETARARLFNEAGELHRFVIVAVNGEEIGLRQKLDTPIQSGDDMAIYPSMSGGRQEAVEVAKSCKPTVSIEIPTVLQKYVSGQAQVELQAETVREALEQVAARSSDMKVRLFNEAGQLNRFIVVFVNEELVFSNSGGEMRHADLLDTPLQQGDEIIITPAAVGG